MKLKIKKLSDNAVIPKRATEKSAGYDLSACLTETLTIEPHAIAKVPTGISAELVSECDAVLLIYARSSLATKFGVTLANCVGVVDSDYRGEIIVAMINHSDKPYTISHGDRIAQLVISPVLLPDVEEAQELSDTARGQGGFGSTGKA